MNGSLQEVTFGLRREATAPRRFRPLMAHPMNPVCRRNCMDGTLATRHADPQSGVALTVATAVQNVPASDSARPGLFGVHPLGCQKSLSGGERVDTLKGGHRTPLTLRAYGLKTGDYQIVSAWWRARHGRAFPENLIPPLGVMAERGGEPVAVLWAYQPAGIGVAFLEYAVTAPGQSFKASREALGRALLGVETILRKDGYSVARCFCQPAMARALRAFGFHGENGNLVKVFQPT